MEEEIKINYIKDFFKKTFFHFVSKSIYYDKLDERSENFYNKICNFYRINSLNNVDIIESRKDYSKWM